MTIWPFAPRSELIEACEWLTDVVPAFDGESRVSLRETPLREFSMDHVARSEQQALARTLANAGGDMLLPEWPRAVVGAAYTGATVALPDGPAVVWVDADTYEQTTVAAGVLGTVVSPRTSARIAPLLACRVSSAWANSRQAGRWAEMKMAFQTVDGADDSDTSRYALFGGLPLVLDACVVGSGTAAEGSEWEIDTVDNGISLPADLTASRRPTEQFAARWIARGVEYVSLRGWIYSRCGRYLPFWLPSWAADDVGAFSQAGSVVTVSRYDPAETAVLLFGGASPVPALISTATAVSGGWQLALSAAPASISRIMYLRRVRFNADRIEFRHAASEPVSVAVQCVRVDA